MRKNIKIFVIAVLALAVTTAARAQFSGSGTQADPYLVSTAADLTTLATKVNNGTGYSGEYFKQTADINMSGIAWAAIGTNQNPFYGNYDGNHKTISNLTCSASSGSFGGLFGKVGNQNNTESRTLKNIRLVNCTISSSSNAAGIVATSTNCNIECCEVMGSISGSSSVGGIAGEMTGGSIEGCFASGTVSASGYSSSKGMILGSTTSAPTCSGNTYISTNSVGAGTSSVANLGTAQPTSGTLSSKISWTLGGTYHTELTITATNNTGGMPWDYSTTTIAGIARTTAPWGWHFSELTVDDGVTIIKNNAFAGNPNLNTVTLPASVYIIGSNAFAGNHNLEIVTLPASGFNIGSGAFADCISLQRVIIQYLSAVPLGANNVFDGCTALQYIDFPNLSAALANTTGNWSGYADKVRALFCGQYFHVTTNGDTYAISTEEDLRNLAAVVNGGNDCEGETFRQTADIDLSSGGDFPMIGKYIGTYFKGTYDGGNRTISGLVVNNNSIKTPDSFVLSNTER